MITITRVLSFDGLSGFFDGGKLTFPPGASEGMFLQQLKMMFEQRPDSLFVCRADSDKDGLVGLVIADLGHVVNLRQAWISPKTTWAVGNELNARLKLWAVAHGRSQIEIRTARSAEAMYRRFGFVETAKIMTQTIPEDFTQRVLDSTKETEVPNG